LVGAAGWVLVAAAGWVLVGVPGWCLTAAAGWCLIAAAGWLGAAGYWSSEVADALMAPPAKCSNPENALNDIDSLYSGRWLGHWLGRWPEH
jgi:hypothetical protein